MPDRKSRRLGLEEATQCLERGIGAEAPPGAKPPRARIEKGKRIISAEVDFPREAFLSAVDIIAKHYERIVDLEPSLHGGHALRADPEPSWRVRESQRLGEDAISFDFVWPWSPGGLTKLTMTKSEDLTEEDVGCALDLWQRSARLVTEKAEPSGAEQSSVEETAEDPRVGLESLGAVVYDRNEEWTWDRIAGYESTKRQIEQAVVLPLLHPEIFRGVAEATRSRPGSNIPRAVLFEGPPGTGKTTTARIIANRSGQPLVYLPVESIMSMWYGASEKRLSEVFEHANALPRSILFLDEIDALAGSRTGAMHEATRRVLSVLLRQLQGISASENVLVLGATNRACDLDAALTSRFNRVIRFGLPNVEERCAIFRSYARHLSTPEATSLAEATEARCGRDIEDICQDAERAWATELVESGDVPSPPPAPFYRRAIESKRSYRRGYAKGVSELESWAEESTWPPDE